MELRFSKLCFRGQKAAMQLQATFICYKLGGAQDAISKETCLLANQPTRHVETSIPYWVIELITVDATRKGKRGRTQHEEGQDIKFPSSPVVFLVGECLLCFVSLISGTMNSTPPYSMLSLNFDSEKPRCQLRAIVIDQRRTLLHVPLNISNREL